MDNNNYTIKDIQVLVNELQFKSLDYKLEDFLEEAIKKNWTNETLLYNMFSKEK